MLGAPQQVGSSRRIAVLVVSAALSGLAVSVLTVAAFGDRTGLSSSCVEFVRAFHERLIAHPIAELRRFRAEYRGMQEARRDLARGELRIKVIGLLAPWYNLYRDRMAREYGITMDAAAGCVVSHEMLGYVNGYNRASWPAIMERASQAEFERVSKDAKEEWEAANE